MSMAMIMMRVMMMIMIIMMMMMMMKCGFVSVSESVISVNKCFEVLIHIIFCFFVKFRGHSSFCVKASNILIRFRSKLTLRLY